MSPLTLRLQASPAAPAAARRWVETIGVVPVQRYPDVVLMVSELVTNAVRHGPPGGLIEVRVFPHPSLRVEVHDAGRTPPPAPSAAAPGGMGLRLVGLLSDRWGVDPGPPTVAWFETRCS